MLDFSGDDEKVKLVAIHYAEEFNNIVMLDVLTRPRGIRNKEEAIIMSRFFWNVLDATTRDRELGISVLDEINLQYRVERLMNIIGGYLKKNGYVPEWDMVCDET